MYGKSEVRMEVAFTVISTSIATPEPNIALTRYSLYCERKLLASIQKSDKLAFAEFFNRYWRKTYLIAYSKIHSREATEEIVQELFILLWDKRATLSINNFSSYLYTCVKNKCLNYIQAQVIKKKHWDYYKTFIPKSADAADKEIGYNDLLDAIKAGMASLPKKTQKVFHLNRLEGRSISEIADVLNLSEKAIEYHLTRSLKQLRIHLKDFIPVLIFFSAHLVSCSI